MGQQLLHRGPDSGSTWANPEAGYAVAFRRLAIIDISEAGNQPMLSASNRFVLTMNGEIYNAPELKAELQHANPAMSFRGHSDTEVLLNAIDTWGFAKTLKKTVGMFAIALWDQEAKMLHLARDRFGEKPLYVGWNGPNFFFASELKAIKAHPEAHLKIDRGAIDLMMRLACVPAPYSIYEGMHKLKPGTIGTIRGSASPGSPLAVESYWDRHEAFSLALADVFSGSPDEAVSAVEGHLLSSVRGQMVSDVPLGAFLSGGIDSTLIVALMQSVSSRPVQTFTIGFEESAYDESSEAKAVAKQLGTDHHELIVGPQAALDVIPSLAGMYDEPFADVSQIPTRLVAAMARRNVTVALSGDAGDEIFAGYNRYSALGGLNRVLQKVPSWARTSCSRAIRSLSPMQWDGIGRTGARIGIKKLQIRNVGEKLYKWSDAASAETSSDIYAQLISHWGPEANLVNGLSDTDVPWLDRRPATENPVDEAMLLDQGGYLPDDILVKVDRASMSVSLEARAPYLDHRLVEFAYRLPLDYKLRNGITKWPLRQVISKFVPDELMNRPKTGFGLPIESWLRHELRDWAEDLLRSERLEAEGFLNPVPIRKAWEAHLSGRQNNQNRLWCVLMFQTWLEENGG